MEWKDCLSLTNQPVCILPVLDLCMTGLLAGHRGGETHTTEAETIDEKLSSESWKSRPSCDSFESVYFCQVRHVLRLSLLFNMYQARCTDVYVALIHWHAWGAARSDRRSIPTQSHHLLQEFDLLHGASPHWNFWICCGSLVVGSSFVWMASFAPILMIPLTVFKIDSYSCKYLEPAQNLFLGSVEI